MNRDRSGPSETTSKESDEEELAWVVDELVQKLRRGERIDWFACFEEHWRHAATLKYLAPVIEGIVMYLPQRTV